jgi:hypothetical protein
MLPPFASLFISESGQPKSQSAPLSSSGKSARESFCCRLMIFLVGTSIVNGCGESIADKVHELTDVLWLKILNINLMLPTVSSYKARN